MPTIKTANSKPKTLIVSRNRVVEMVSHLLLRNQTSCHTILSAPDGKQTLKNSDDISLLILDWSLQDKYGSIMKCLKEAKTRKNILTINIFATPAQKTLIFQNLPNLKANKNVFSVVNEFLFVSLAIELIKARTLLQKRLTTNG